jgi:hypothetical protein
MEETRLYFKAHPNKTLAQGKVKGWKLEKDPITLALVVNSTGTNKLKLQGRNLVSMFGGAWMKGGVFEAWILQLNNHFKGQNRKVIIILDNVSFTCG